MVVDRPHNHGSAKIKGKEKVTVFQNLKSSIPNNSYRDQGRSYSRKDTGIQHNLGQIYCLILT